MRLLSLAVLGVLLGIVYWIGATVYTDRIEQDITQRSTEALAKYQPGLEVDVNGRDVSIKGQVESEQKRDEILDVADNVWGVRKTAADQLAVVAPEPEPEPIPEPEADKPFNFRSTYDGQNLHMSGLVDDDNVVALLDEIPNALPPSTNITRGPLETGAAPLVNSPRKVETGIAALTQLSRGDLTITDKDFILNGVVGNEAGRQAIEDLIATRRAELDPLNVILNITVDPYHHLTQVCRDAIRSALQGNVLNYKVDHSNIEDQYLAMLSQVAVTVTEHCENQISQVLIEGHADYTGGEGYNQGLSERRADTVFDHLRDVGIPVELLAAFGYGEFRPVASNETVAGRAKNRRVEIHLSTRPVTVDPDDMFISTNTED